MRSRGLAPILAPILGLVSAGCILQSPDFDESPPTSSTTATGATATATATATTTTTAESSSSATSSASEPTTTLATTTDGSASSGSTTSTTTTTTSTGATTDDNGADFPVTSCDALREFLKARDLPLTSGVYEVQSPVDLEPVRVYCDLEIAGGGWLLAGRSTRAGAVGSFGWHSQTGDVDDDDAPYSLGFHLHPFEFSEILIGSYDGGKDWGEYVYQLDVPDDLVPTFQIAAAKTTYIGAVEGQCDPQGGPLTFSYIGNTGKTDTFWLHNEDDADAGFGLRHNRFDTLIDDCQGGGLLTDKQGMIMVR